MITKGEYTRQGIISAAYELFIQKGFNGTSMRQIAKNAQIALGGIYNHFENKEQIFAEVLDTYHPYHGILPTLLEAPGETPEEIIQESITKIREFLDARPQFMNLVFIEIVEFEGRHLSTLMEKAMPLFGRLVQRFNSLDTELRPIPIAIILQTFLGLVFSYALTGRVKVGSGLDMFQADTLESMADIFLYGILTRRIDG